MQLQFANNPSYLDEPLGQALIADLYRYPLRRRREVFWVWLLTGLFGGHRYYLNRIPSGALMTLTYGGGGIWWLLDGLRLYRMVDEYNSRQMLRRTRREPPLELDYLPSLDRDSLHRPVGWASREPRKLASLFPETIGRDMLVVVVVSALLAWACDDNGEYEPLGAMLALIVLVNAAEWLVGLSGRSRIVREILQWDIKLRLYYHAYGFPKPRRLFFRPLAGLVQIFQKDGANEVRLYLEVSYVFTIVFTALNVLGGEYWNYLAEADYLGLVHEWLTDNLLLFALIYCCLTPLGATLMKFSWGQPNAARDRFVLSATALLTILLILL